MIPTVGSLFAGLGGFAVAFARQGFRPIWANEIDKFAAQTYRHNLPTSQLLEGDVRNFSPAQMGLSAPDVLTAGFPCQPFSSAGDRLGLSDDRGMLYEQITRILGEYGDSRPSLVLLENVSNLVGHDRGKAFMAIQNSLRNAGYWVLPQNIKRLNTRIHTSIPQNRERLFIVALSTRAFKGGTFNFPEPSSALRPLTDFLDLSQRADDYYYFDTKNNRYGEMILRKVQSGAQNSVYQLRRSYVREHKTFVPTLTANMGDGGHNVPVIIDKWGLRKLTPWECARLQGHDGSDFNFPKSISRVQSFKQIGNSVTIPLIEALAAGCMSLLSDNRKRITA